MSRNKIALITGVTGHDGAYPAELLLKTRPTEVDLLMGDPTKAHEKLGWRHEIDLDDLVAEMVREDLRVMARAVPQPMNSMALAYD